MDEQKVLEYFNFDTLAANVWKSKYQLKDENGNPLEETPDDMHRRLAKEFARVEFENIGKDSSRTNELSEFGQQLQYKWSQLSLQEIEDIIFNYFQGFKQILPQGSICASLGTNLPVSLSNCLRLPPPDDSYSSIMYTDNQLVNAAKRRCGYGLGISNLRPNGAKVKNSAKTSTGAVSFMSRFSNSTREVAQEGRRGACLLDIEVKHPDVKEFAEIKKDLSQVTGANISIKLFNDFMIAAKEDRDYLLCFPTTFDTSNLVIEDYEYNKLVEIAPSIYIKRIKAKEYFDVFIENAWKTAEPGLFYWDRMLNYDPASVYDELRPDGTNACVTGETEILTQEGYERIDRLIGQEVQVWNGFEWSKVIPRVTGYNQHLLKVTLSDGRSLTCTDYHKWYISKGYNGQQEQVTTNSLKIGDKLIKYNFPVLEGIENINIKNAYTQGFISGDGQDNYNFLWLYEPKFDCISNLDVKHEGAIFTTTSGIKRKCIYFNDSYYPKDFVPFYWTTNSKLSWLAGLLDSDGTELKEGGAQIVSINKQFLLDVQQLLSTVGVNSKVVFAEKEGFRNLPDGKGGNKDYWCQEGWRICIGATQIQTLKSLGLTCVRLKFDKTPNRDASQFVKIISIEDVGYASEVYCFTEHKRHLGVFNGILTGQCGEQPMTVGDTCRLICTNLFGLVDNPFTKDSSLNLERAYEIFYIQLRLGDDLVDLEIEYVNRIIEKIKQDPEPDHVKLPELLLWENVRDKAIKGRRCGSGITALGDMLAALNLKYDSQEALNIVEQLMQTKMRAELDCSIDLAILRGAFPLFDPNKEFKVIINQEPHYNELVEEGNNSFYQMIYEEFPEQMNKMVILGRRNVNWSTIAPVGTLSIMSQTTSSGEPLFYAYYMRRKKANPNDKDVRVDFKDQNGDCWTEFSVLHPKFKEWLQNHEASGIDPKLVANTENISKDDLQYYFEKSPWYNATANDIDWNKRVEMQSILQKYTTSAISSTINLPSTVTKEEVANIYWKGWEMGLKGVTIYTDGCRTGVLVNTETKKVAFSEHDATERPNVLHADGHLVSVKGQEYFVVVGLLDGKPYEVFATHNEWNVPKSFACTVAKKGKGKYRIDIPDIIRIEDFTSKITDEEAAVTRLLSTSLRHGTNVKYLIEQLNKSQGNIVGFTKAIIRCLKKYLKDGEEIKGDCPECGGKLRREEGCKSCPDCGYKAC